MKKVRVRYAPSPTGHLHIGGARTALFNYLFTKHYGGDFIFRLEDTDIERNIPHGEESQLDNLAWLGLEFDESPLKPGKYGPYRQTERLDIYREYAQKLIDENKAYECFCTSEDLDGSRKRQEANNQFSFRYEKTCKHLTEAQKEAFRKEGRTSSIRFAVDEDKLYTWNDIVRDEISVLGKDISDWVILKSNGIATYNFCVAIDDALMEISHVFRGEEHISNTPKQIMIYDALNLEQPEFGHLTLIVNEARKKLSKRDETIMQFISQYRAEGYLAPAMFNFFSLLGWSPVEEEEIFSVEQLIKIFDESRLSKSPSMFDKKKLHWTNNYYIKNYDPKVINEMASEFLNSAYDLNNMSQEWLNKVVELFKPQLNYIKEIVELVKPFFEDYSLSEEDTLFLKEVDAKPLLIALEQGLESLEDFNAVSIKELVNKVGSDLNRKGKNLFMPIRLGVSAQKSGADLPSVIELYGKDQAIKNINTCISKL